MWTEWFEQSEETLVSIGKPLWHNKLDHLADCDVALEFCDSGHRFHVVRCSAKEFLCSPWEGPAGTNSTYSMFRASESYSDPNIYIMGQVSGHRFCNSHAWRMDLTIAHTRTSSGRTW